jgi:hypothetical protein
MRLGQQQLGLQVVVWLARQEQRPLGQKVQVRRRHQR